MLFCVSNNKLCTSFANGKDIIAAEEIKKRWKEYTEELDKKYLSDSDNLDGIVSYSKPDILECEVKWTSGSITMDKPSRGDGIPAKLLKILKNDAIKVLHSICQQIWKTQQTVATGLEKINTHPNSQEEQY